MQTITYRITRLTMFELLTSWICGCAGLLWLASVVFDSWRAGTLHEVWSLDLFNMPVDILLVLFMFFVAFTAWADSLKKGEYGFLELDSQGLTHAEGRSSVRRWRWDELSDFKLERLWWGYSQILFCIPGQASRLTQYLNPYFSEGRLVVIRNSYDTPLPEVADRLNEFRERAVGGDTAGAVWDRRPPTLPRDA